VPLIYALSHSSLEDTARLRRAIEVGGIEDLAASPAQLNRQGGLSTLRGSRGGRRISRSKPSAGSPIRPI
jgi:hypothetical protein